MVAATSEGLERVSAERRARWLRSGAGGGVLPVVLVGAGGARRARVRAVAAGGAPLHGPLPARSPRRRRLMPVRPLPGPPDLARRPARGAAADRRRRAREPGAAHGRADVRRRPVRAHARDPARARSAITRTRRSSSSAAPRAAWSRCCGTSRRPATSSPITPTATPTCCALRDAQAHAAAALDARARRARDRRAAALLPAALRRDRAGRQPARAAASGMVPVLWSVDSRDWQLPGTQGDRAPRARQRRSRARSSSCTTAAATARRRCAPCPRSCARWSAATCAPSRSRACSQQRAARRRAFVSGSFAGGGVRPLGLLARHGSGAPRP